MSDEYLELRRIIYIEERSMAGLLGVPTIEAMTEVLMIVLASHSEGEFRRVVNHVIDGMAQCKRLLTEAVETGTFDDALGERISGMLDDIAKTIQAEWRDDSKAPPAFMIVPADWRTQKH